MDDAACMQLALAQARLAALAGEVPVGAVVVKDGRVVGVGHNAPLGTHDPTAHAEIIALRAAAQTLGNYRLDGCALFVTLEPCAMCSGAMLHARISRVVFGAFDPKTGAAGSVLNLFAQRTLNHQTSVQGGVLAEEAASVMQAFFQTKRVEKSLQKKALHPLRDDALRTPDACFANVLDYPWAPHYLSDLPSLAGLRMHYLDVGDSAAPITYLCLHGNPSWSYVYRKMIPGFLASGARVVAPDLIGFGKSDKPKKESNHRFSWHRDILLEFVERLDLRNVVLVVQDWGGILGLTLPMEAPHRYAGLLAMNTLLATGDGALTPGFLAWREMCAKNPEFDIGCLLARGNPQMGAAECAAYMAPFPDKGHRSATRAFPAMVPHTPDSDGAALSVRARAFWQQQWSGRSLMAIGMQDPVLGEGTMLALHATVRGCAAPLRIDTAGHFVQEHGQSFVRVVTEYFQ